MTPFSEAAFAACPSDNAKTKMIDAMKRALRMRCSSETLGCQPQPIDASYATLTRSRSARVQYVKLDVDRSAKNVVAGRRGLDEGERGEAERALMRRR